MNAEQRIYFISNNSLLAAAFKFWLNNSFKNRVIETCNVGEYLQKKPTYGSQLFLHAETFEPDESLLIAKHISQFNSIFALGCNQQNTMALVSPIKTDGFINLSNKIEQLASDLYNAIAFNPLSQQSSELNEIGTLLRQLRFSINTWNLDAKEILLLKLLQKDVSDKNLATEMKLGRSTIKQMQADIAKKFQLYNSKNLIVQHAISLGILNLEENDVHPLTTNFTGVSL
jgi:hypothetical protein